MILKEKIRKTYDRHAFSYDTGAHMQRSLAGMLAEKIKEDKVDISCILDVGCGTGYVAEKMKERSLEDAARKKGAFFIGCDISFSMLSRAKDKLKRAGRFYCAQADAENLPFSDYSFRTVVSSAAYQWVADLSGAFKEIARVLASGGSFYFTIFNNNTLWQLQEVCRQAGVAAPASGNFINRDILLFELRKAGFDVIGMEVFKYENYYKDLFELLKSLKNMGVAVRNEPGVGVGLGWRSFLTRASILYNAKFGSKKGIPASFEAFLVRARKK